MASVHETDAINEACDEEITKMKLKAKNIVGEECDDSSKASFLRKIMCLITVFTYLVGGFWLSRTRIEFLDNLIASVTPSIVSSSFEYIINHSVDTFGKFQIAVIGTAIVHQIVYWMLCLPSFLYQFYPPMKKYKIQENDVPMEKQWNCFKTVMYNQCFIEIPIMVGNYYFADFMEYGWSYESFPTLYQFIGMMVGCLAIEDTWHFFVHRHLHKGNLYTKIHKMHHEFRTPVGMQAEYAHPLEIFALAIGFTLGCCVYCNHFFCTWAWMCVRLTETIEVHGGYDKMLYFNAFSFLPFYGGPRFHDFHHYNFVGNYASTFTCWDEIFDTLVQYRSFCRKKQIAQSACKEGVDCDKSD